MPAANRQWRSLAKQPAAGPPWQPSRAAPPPKGVGQLAEEPAGRQTSRLRLAEMPREILAKLETGDSMADYIPPILGSVMKHIACTPNKNFDNDAYDRGVIEPARAIRKVYEELGEARPSDEQIRTAVGHLLTIFETKMVDMDEREDRLKELLDMHQLHSLFPDLLPLKKTASAS